MHAVLSTASAYAPAREWEQAVGAPGGGTVASREEDPGETHQAADDVDEPVPADRRIRVARRQRSRARDAEDDEVVDALDPQRVLLFVASCQ